MKLSKGKGERALCTAKVGSKGQIVIPQKISFLFNISPGDSIVLLADSSKGITLLGEDYLQKFIHNISAPNNGEEE